MKLLIVGASGLAGRYLLSEAGQRGLAAVGTHHENPTPTTIPLSLANTPSFAKILDSVQPDAVIFCAAMVWADACEKHKDLATQINESAPTEMAKACQPRKIKLAFISSNYVFDGTRPPYSESDTPRPINHYGVTKLNAERNISHILGDQALIIRTCGIYGDDPLQKSFLSRLVRCLQQGSKVRIPNDQYQNATFAGDLVSAILDLLALNASGIWNIAGPNPFVRRDTLAIQIARTYSLDETLIQPVPTSELNQFALRPMSCGLSNEKAKNIINYSPKDHFFFPSLLYPKS